MYINRRRFIKGIAAVAAAIPVTKSFASLVTDNSESHYPIYFFTKPLDGYEVNFMAETLAEAGAEGFDLTVRPGGRIEPKQISEDLPSVIEIGKKNGLKTELMVTAIKSANETHTRKVLECAVASGIRHYRLGYYQYDFEKEISSSLVLIQDEINQLAQLNKELGIQGGYQNHTGRQFGAPLWDLWSLIKDLPKEFFCSQFDIRHAVTEGSSSWILALHLLKNNIGSLAIKDFIWDISTHRAKVVGLPLGEGIVDFDLFFRSLKGLNIQAPISLHIEYPLLTKEQENLSLLQKQKILIAKIKKDVDFIRVNLKKHQLF